MIRSIVKKWLEAFLSRYGYELVHRTYSSHDMIEPEFWFIYEKCKLHLKQTSIVNSYALFKAVQYVVRHKIPGDLVEGGVYEGGSVMMMAYSLICFGDTNRKIYLYDTYQGMVEPGKEDRHVDSSVDAQKIW